MWSKDLINMHRIAQAVLYFAFVAFSSAISAQVDVLTHHNNRERTGTNLHETDLNPANVNAKQFGMLFKRVVDDQLYAQPLLATNIKIAGGWHDVVYVTTVNNSVYAFDANDSEASLPVWHVNFGTPANVHSTNFGCLDINGQTGIEVAQHIPHGCPDLQRIATRPHHQPGLTRWRLQHGGKHRGMRI